MFSCSGGGAYGFWIDADAISERGVNVTMGTPLCGPLPANVGSACAILNNSVVSVGGYDCASAQLMQVLLRSSAHAILLHAATSLTFLLYWRIQVFTGRAASFSELHGGSFITSATPSTISTTGGTTITLMGSNLCRRDISVAIDRSYSTISLVASDKIVLRAPGGLNRQPSLNLSYSLLWYLAPALC